MRGLDTNVLVRYLVADEPAQTASAIKIVEDARRTGELLFISIAVLCELVWVLSRSYGQAKAQIAGTNDLMLATIQFQIENDALVRRGLDAYRNGRADFADYLIGEICREAGCGDCVTFDRALMGAEGFTVLR